jgi:hypothetical protein
MRSKGLGEQLGASGNPSKGLSYSHWPLLGISRSATAVRKLVFTLFEPGALRSVLQIQRLSPGIYRANILTGAFEGTSSMAAGHEEIYVARARAIYRYLSRNKVHRTNQAHGGLVCLRNLIIWGTAM